MSNKKQNYLLLITNYLLLIALLFFVVPKITAAQEDVGDLNQEIEAKKQNIEALEKKLKVYQDKIEETKQEAVTLNNELAIIDNEMAKIELDIEITEQQIQKTNLEIQAANAAIAAKQQEISGQKQEITDFIRLINSNDQVSYLEVLLTRNSFSEFYDYYNYVSQIHKNLHESLLKLKNLKADLELQKQTLEVKKQQEEELKSNYENQKLDLLEKINAKETLLYETKRSERRFQNYVYQLKLEQQQINSEIISLEKKVREELERQKEAERFQNFGPARFSWPVPKNTITATFHDPDYPYRYIFEHPAIDIRAAQGATVVAAESGYVARVKDGGKAGYSYIMLIHNDGFSTVYGHVSKILINQDQFVVKGDTIALSGGKPGTPGAGSLTTGPHLHFEVRLNGIPVNPLEYLP